MTATELQVMLQEKGIEDDVLEETLTMLKENRNPEIVLQAAQTLDSYKMYELQRAWNDGRTDEQVEWLASINLTWLQMSQLRKAWQDGRTDEQVKWFASTGFNADEMKQLREAWNDGRTNDQVAWLVSNNLGYELIEKCALEQVMQLLQENRNQEIVLQAARALNGDQIEQLRLAWKDGRTDEQVEWLASANLNWEQMKQFREFWNNGRTDEQVKWLASTDLSWQQMKQLRGAWNDGRTDAQVKWLASTNLDRDQMEQQRKAWKAEEVAFTPVAPVQPTNGTMQTMNSFGSMRPHTDSSDMRPYMENGAIGYQLQVESPEEEVIQYALQNGLRDSQIAYVTSLDMSVEEKKQLIRERKGARVQQSGIEGMLDDLVRSRQMRN